MQEAKERRWTESGAAHWRVLVEEMKELDIEMDKCTADEGRERNRKNTEERKNDSISKEEKGKESDETGKENEGKEEKEKAGKMKTGHKKKMRARVSITEDEIADKRRKKKEEGENKCGSNRST